jgi:hypothetical protein
MTQVQKTKNPRKTNTSNISRDKEFEDMKRQIAELSKALLKNEPVPTSGTSIDLDEDIDVVSLCNNKLNLSTGGFGKGELYWFENFGEVKPIPFRDLKEIVKNNRTFLEKGYYYVESDKARKALRISRIYDNLPAAQDLINLLDKDIKTIKVILEKMTPEQKTMISSVVVNKLYNNEKIDMNIVKEIGDSIGRDLATVAKDKRESVSGGEE